VPILDLVAPTREQLDRAVAFVREHASRGVYVHCALGRSRAPAVAAAYLRPARTEPGA
jgi:diacylglycerol kinase (ATP)